MDEDGDVPEYYREDDEDEGGEEEDGGGKEFYEFQPLPTLLEDEENVSLADILSLRDNCLAEQDIWAICLECCYSMKDISHAAIFQTLCITPDTLAFNTSGNVCFMEQLSDDPEGAFVPPEFDLTGNTIEGHIYSLGATLKAAIEFVVDPDSDAEFCQDLNSLLDSMQQENPADRPDIESIISLCEEKINVASSSVCRSLSSIGRRVLSIESVSAFQDGWESLWKGIGKKENCTKVPAVEKVPNRISTIPENCSVSPTGFCPSSDPVQEEEHQNGWRETEFKLERPCSSPISFGHHLKKNKRERSKSSSPEKIEERFERAKVEDEMAKLSIKRHRRSKHSSAVSNVEKRSPPGGGMVTLKSWPSVPSCLSPNEDQDPADGHMAQSGLPVPNHTNCVSPLGQSKCHSQVSYENLVTALEQENQHLLCTDRNQFSQKYPPSEDPVLDAIRLNIKQSQEAFASAPVYEEDVLSMSRLVNSPEVDPDFSDGYEAAAVNKDQRWVSLKEVLLNYGKPLHEDELWALCYECLYTLRTYVDYPAILSLESVFVDRCGEVLFVTHQNEEPYDAFCVPPEYDPDGDVAGTEKSCVYGIAAILWSAAKYNFPANHKLTLPKKLKRFLLQMAKRDCDERPSLAEALQVCKKYLEQKNLDSKAIWSCLINLMDQSDPIGLYPEEDAAHIPESSAGFVPVATHTRLTAVKGPVPLSDLPNNLPAAFTSPATYFKPIVLMQHTDINSNQIPRPSPYPKPPASAEALDHLEEDISVAEMENHVAEDRINQVLKSGGGSLRTKVSFKTDADISDCSCDRKEKSSSVASSVSSNSSTLTSSPIVNNYLLKQDPKTGNLTLVRVQLSIPEHIPSVSLEAEPVSQTIKTSSVSPPGTLTVNDLVNSDDLKSSKMSPAASYDRCKESQTASDDGLPTTNGTLLNNGPEIQDSPSKTAETLANGESPLRRNLCSPLQRVVNLLHEEFAFDGYLENGVEDMAMGEYIFALKGLQHTTFCSAICEKFCDLYWDDLLLQNLYKIINGRSPPPPSRKTVADSSPHSDPTQLLKKIQRKTRKNKQHGRPTTNEQSNRSDGEESTDSPSHAAAEPESPPSHYSLSPEDIDATIQIQLPGSESQVAAAGSERQASFDETDLIDSPPQTKDKDQRPRAPRSAAGRDENFTYGDFTDCNSLCVSPDFTDDGEDVKQRESMSVSPSEVYKCSSGWSSAFYGAEMFDPDVQHYVTILGRQKEKGAKSMDAKRLELEQQLMIETKNYRKTVKLYQNLKLKGKRSKGSDVKELLPKLKGHLEEMKPKVQFLELAKKLLQVSYAEQYGVDSRELPTVAHLASLSSLRSAENEAFLLLYNEKGHKREHTSKNLQAGTALGLLVHLYARSSVVDGYVQQFFYAFRYFCSQEDLLQFFMDRIKNTFPREDTTDPSALDAKIYHRSLVLLQAWIEECWNIDFSMNPDLLDKLEDFSNSQIFPKDERGDYLASLLQELCSKKYTVSSPTLGSERKDCTKSLHSLCTTFSEDTVSRKSFNWRLSKGNGLHILHPRDKQYTISAALPRPCYPGLVEDLSSYYLKGEECGTYSIQECSVQQIATQLTLLQEEIFQKCHPVNFLNSRVLGVKDKSSNVPKASSVEPLSVEVCSLFAPNCAQDKYLLQMLRFADNVSTWVAAEIVTCHTSKLQTSLLTKFLLVTKLCYEQRDFATAVQILGGLENLIVRQLPAWKNLPTKVAEILEEVKAVEVFLKSDSLCLMKGDRFRTLPTIPSAYLLAMHIQQLETGGFTMANGAFKWNKLRNIAKVVSQVHAFQEIPYSFTPDPDLQFYLRQRISHFSDADISVLAADNNANFHHVNSEKHTRKIQDTLRRMRATFQ